MVLYTSALELHSEWCTVHQCDVFYVVTYQVTAHGTWWVPSQRFLPCNLISSLLERSKPLIISYIVYFDKVISKSLSSLNCMEMGLPITRAPGHFQFLFIFIFIFASSLALPQSTLILKWGYFMSWIYFKFSLCFEGLHFVGSTTSRSKW